MWILSAGAAAIALARVSYVENVNISDRTAFRTAYNSTGVIPKLFYGISIFFLAVAIQVCYCNSS